MTYVLPSVSAEAVLCRHMCYENRIRMHHTDPVNALLESVVSSVLLLFFVKTLLCITYYSSTDTFVRKELQKL